MKIYLKERIGNPELFTGRKREMNHLLHWAGGIKDELSKSKAIISRRKTGKTAIMERLYNIIFHRNDGVIPFYYEIKETDQWICHFARDFFLTFIYQYIAFKTRKTEYLKYSTNNLETARKTAINENLDYLVPLIDDMNTDYDGPAGDVTVWDVAREAPETIAVLQNEKVVQIVDEFQFINRYVYRDRACKNLITNLSGSYLHTAERKNAPLLISGSWVGWLMYDVITGLPGRFTVYPLGKMPEHEAVEMIFKYAHINRIPVTPESAHLIARLTEGGPFYISSMFESLFPDRDLSTEQGVMKTFEFETLNYNGLINKVWMEYLYSAFSRINDVFAKNIVLYLSKNRNRKVTRKELKEKLGMTEMSDMDLEKKLSALHRCDIIEEHEGFYTGVQDNIFDKVFRRTFGPDIDRFVTKEAPDEYERLLRDVQRRYKSLEGEYNRFKGAFAEYVMIQHLRFDAYKDSSHYTSMFGNLPNDFQFAKYETVWSYYSPPLHTPEFQIDIFARAPDNEYSLIGEVKNRKGKYAIKEAENFIRSANELMKLEGLEKAVVFVFSVNGFFNNTLDYFKQHGLAWASDRRLITK